MRDSDASLPSMIPAGIERAVDQSSELVRCRKLLIKLLDVHFSCLTPMIGNDDRPFNERSTRENIQHAFDHHVHADGEDEQPKHAVERSDGIHI